MSLMAVSYSTMFKAMAQNIQSHLHPLTADDA